MSRRLIALLLILVPALALAQDEKKIDLVYRWDLLDGKTAVYDCEVVSVVQVDRKSLADTGEVDPNASEDRAPTALEGTTRTKQRLLVTFARGDRDRGRVTFETERLEVSVTQKASGTSETISYDSKDSGADVPRELKATVDSLLGKPYTLIVSRRGQVEGVEGRPKSELEGFKSAFLLFPDAPRAKGEGWSRTQRHPTHPLGLIVTRWSHQLASVTDDERTVETKITTELDDTGSQLPVGAGARIEGAHGQSRIVIDARGLKKSEDERTGYELIVKQVRPDLEQRNKLESTTTWKLVELREAKK